MEDSGEAAPRTPVGSHEHPSNGAIESAPIGCEGGAPGDVVSPVAPDAG